MIYFSQIKNNQERVDHSKSWHLNYSLKNPVICTVNPLAIYISQEEMTMVDTGSDRGGYDEKYVIVS